jgi:F-type H+-transporting ATPase subunit epsilon
MSSLRIKIIQPTRIVLDTECDHCIIPGSAGDFGVSVDHTPFISIIRPGTITIYKKESKQLLAVHDGFVTVENNVVRIVAEVVELQSEIDSSRAQSAQQRAEERLKSEQQAEVDHRRAEISLKRALARIQTIKET